MAERIRQQYHLEPNYGLLNDPNGLCWFKGKYYVFFQWNRFEKNHCYKEWGLFTSENLIEWEFKESALIPDQEYDLNGVYSGSGHVIEDELYLFYTGNRKVNGERRSSQCLAVTVDGKTYKKRGIILETPAAYTEHFRDPKVFRGKHSGYFMIIGGQRENGKGALALCCSEDGQNWAYQRMAAVSEEFEMIECPDLFELNGTYILLYNPQKRNNETDEPISGFSAYKVLHAEDESFLSDINLDVDYEIMESGFDFYAPQTFEAPDGRRILLAWMSRMEEQQEKVFSESEPNIHCMTIPRELYLQGKMLCQRPIRELYHLLGELIAVRKENGVWSINPCGRNFYLKLEGNKHNSEFCVDFHNGEVVLEYKSTHQTLVLSRKNWVTGVMESRKAVVDSWDEIEIWSDYSSMEIFVDGGRVVFSARIFPENSMLEIKVTRAVEDIKIKIHRIMGKNEGGKGYE